MNLSFDYIKPYKAGRLEIKYAHDDSTLHCCVDGKIWMDYDSKNSISAKQLLAEVELAYGHCLVTGLGFGLRETLLLQKPEVTKLTVIEQCQDIADWYCQTAKEINLPVEKLNIIVKDADTLEGMECDCLFIDHFDAQIRDSIITNSKTIAQRNAHKVFWFWPALKIFALWAKDNHRKIDVSSFEEWQKAVGLEGMLPELDASFIQRNTRHYFGLNVVGTHSVTGERN